MDERVLLALFFVFVAVIGVLAYKKASRSPKGTGKDFPPPKDQADR